MALPLSSPTLQDLIQAARDMLNQPDPNNSFWNDEELTRYFNEAVRIHMAELADIDEGQFTTTAYLNITSGQELIPLPSDFFTMKSAYRILSQRNVPMAYNNNINEAYSTATTATSGNYIPEYYFRGMNLVVHPIPSTTEANGIFIEYTQYPLVMLDGSDQVSVQIGVLFRQSIEMYGIYKAKLKESLANNIKVHETALQNWEGLFQQFKDLSAKRSRRLTAIRPFDP